jgi:hypothetical protein
MTINANFIVYILLLYVLGLRFKLLLAELHGIAGLFLSLSLCLSVPNPMFFNLGSAEPMGFSKSLLGSAKFLFKKTQIL